MSSELTHRINQVLELGIFPGVLQRGFYWSRMIISQKYQGDITIVPPVPPLDYFSLMTNPNHDDLNRKLKLAERAAWQSTLSLSLTELRHFSECVLVL